MTFKNKLEIISKSCKFILFFTIFFNSILISKLHANSFKINEIEVFEDFNLDFNKKKVFDKAFESAFFQLISSVVISKDIENVQKYLSERALIKEIYVPGKIVNFQI